jgi:hypothetical protein
MGESGMKAFHGNSAIKGKYLERVKQHAVMDEIVKGQYWNYGKGCAVGCTIHSDKHDNYETELGIPTLLAYLEDRIFENLPNDLAMTWPLRFLEAIGVGTDLELVWPKFAHWLLVDPDHGVVRFNKHQSILDAASLLNRWIDGNKPDLSEWRDAAAAADAAVSYAAAAVSYAASYADAAADAAYDASYADAAADAAYDDAAAAYDAAAVSYAASAYTAAAVSYAASAYAAAYAGYGYARKKHFVIMSEKLLQLLMEAK